jgi:hypothetical protein
LRTRNQSLVCILRFVAREMALSALWNTLETTFRALLSLLPVSCPGSRIPARSIPFFSCPVSARDVLATDRFAVIADSPSLPRRELEEAVEIAEQFHIPLRIVKTAEFANESYLSNPANRCYFCKHELFTELEPIARAEGFAVIAYGENASDVGDFPPGRASGEGISGASAVEGSRADEDGDPRTFGAAWLAHGGQAANGMSQLAHSVRRASHAGEVADDRDGGRRAAGAWVL